MVKELAAFVQLFTAQVYVQFLEKITMLLGSAHPSFMDFQADAPSFGALGQSQ